MTVTIGEAATACKGRSLAMNSSSSASALPGNKRLKSRIIPPRRPAHSADLYGELWTKIEQAIQQIYGMNSSALSFEELYRASYTLVVNKKGSQLYQDVGRKLKSILQQTTTDRVVVAFPANRDNLDDCSRFLNILADIWDKHTEDRVYVRTLDTQPVYEVGMDIFRDVILRSDDHPVHAQILSVLLTMIERERRGEVINTIDIRRVTQLQLQLSNDNASKDGQSTVYEADFENDFLKATKEYYNVQAQNLLATGDIADYLIKIEHWFEEETSRARRYLTEMTNQKVRSLLEQELVSNYLDTIVDFVCLFVRTIDGTNRYAIYVANEKMQDLNRMYRMLSYVEQGHNTMRKTMNNYIHICGRDINQTVIEEEKERATASTDGAADKKEQKKRKFNRILNEAFGGDKSFQICISEAFSVFINENESSVEYISLFIDENLQRSIKGKIEQEVDTILDNAISLFRYVDNKDLFERYYKQHLALRLLQSKSASDDAERSMIAKLRIECGVQFTSKLEGMFNDMKLSSDIMHDFKEAQAESEENKSSFGEINVQVLTSTYWPMAQKTDQCVLPLMLREAQEQFTNYYLSRYSGRKLMFQLNMGTAEVRAYFNGKRHDLIVPTYSLVILMLFNQTDDWISYEQLLAETGIPAEQLQRNLQSLISPKHPILCKDPPVKTMPQVQPDHRFRFNNEFKSKLLRIRITSSGPRLEQAAERKVTMERVNEERQIQTDACIVRVMKSRRTMEHNTLVAEVTRQLLSRFRPDPSIIKRRIDSLIEREYLERAPDDL
ncbi:Cullin-domain-containing protein [Syncephalis plumigaleata]|nr:Cullin-domain-containing protein [Syncephalis plumigaleata]